MSDCRNGGRLVYERHGMFPRQDVREYDMTPTIRFAAVFENGTDRTFTMNGATYEGKRVLSHFEVRDEDGNTLECYVKERTCRMEHVKGGPLCDLWRFTCCGYEWTEDRCSQHQTELPGTVCPNCGARVVDG